MKNVVLLEYNQQNPYLHDLQKKIVTTVETKQCEWKVVRVFTDGIIDIK